MQAVYADTLRWRGGGAPFDGTGLPPSQAAPSAENRVAVESRLTLSDMALATIRVLLETSPYTATPAPDQIIVCTTSFEHDLALSCACRLHSELGSSRAPLAVGQLQGVSFLMAVEVALAMMAADVHLNIIVIVAAERWRPPFLRQVGTRIEMGDGAAAVLIARQPAPGWRVRAITLRTPATAHFSSEPERVDTSMLAEIINETCAKAELPAADVDWILPAAIDTGLAREIHTRCGLRPERIGRIHMDVPGHFCAADTPARLDTLLRSIDPDEGQHILVWSAGFHGQAGCALLEFCGGGS
ncbi:3-oxoacyl-[acyl-carrier-protein] synthase III C-terminal domain-containing protein [Burkholderia sp. AW49-1]